MVQMFRIWKGKKLAKRVASSWQSCRTWRSAVDWRWAAKK